MYVCMYLCVCVCVYVCVYVCMCTDLYVNMAYKIHTHTIHRNIHTQILTFSHVACRVCVINNKLRLRMESYIQTPPQNGEYTNSASEWRVIYKPPLRMESIQTPPQNGELYIVYDMNKIHACTEICMHKYSHSAM